jgi:uncharacterized protein related to proFAR isomerase
MKLIFMLTHHDCTVANCLEVLDAALPLGITDIGFKDIGVAPDVLRTLNQRIRSAGATSYLEIVSETPDACLQLVRSGLDLPVDRLLGGTDIKSVLPVLADSGIAYFPFAGFPTGHPTQLAGSPEEVAEHCQTFMAQGAAGVDLLAYRAVEADPLDLVRAAREGLGDGELIVAGSISGSEQLRRLHDLGVDAVTIGTALFSEDYADARSGVVAQLEAALETMATLN